MLSQKDNRHSGPSFRRRKREAERPRLRVGPAGSLQILRIRVNVKLESGRAAPFNGCGWKQLWRTAFEVVIQNDRFRDLFHGPAPLLAFPLQGSVGILLADLQVALQDAFGSLDEFSAFQLI